MHLYKSTVNEVGFITEDKQVNLCKLIFISEKLEIFLKKYALCEEELLINLNRLLNNN